jgi:hypothetical protein
MEKGQAWVDVRKEYQRARNKNINMTAPVLFELFSAQTHNSSFRPSPRPGELPSPFKKMTTTGVRQTFQRLIPDVIRVTWFL